MNPKTPLDPMVQFYIQGMKINTLALFIFVFFSYFEYPQITPSNEIMYKYRDTDMCLCMYKICTHAAKRVTKIAAGIQPNSI